MRLVWPNKSSIAIFYHIGLVIEYRNAKALWRKKTVMINLRLRVVMRRIAGPSAGMINYLSEDHIGKRVGLSIEDGPD